MSDQPKLPVETPREWFRYGDGDLSVAEREFQSDMPVFHTICFLCQSATEKLLKGYLISQGWLLEKTHDIVELLEYAADYDVELGSMLAEGAILNEYIVAGRYPGDIADEGISKAEAKEALDAAGRIRDRVKHLLDFYPGEEEND